MKAERPKEIGGYRILATLGRGGMGAVYRARDGDGRSVALKLLHAHLDDPDARERLRREVAALQKIRHPGVARVLDAEIESTEAFVVTELVPGKDLARTVRQRGPMPPAELAELAAQLRDALAVVHKKRLLHRDLTPGNVMVTPEGPVLIDFGLAQAVEDARVTSTGLVTGTPGYVAPELLDGRQPSVASDWWGWAAVLTFAATGRPPFGRGAIGTVLTRVRAGEPDLKGVDADVAEALRGGLAVAPRDRVAPAALVAALEAAAARAAEEAEDATNDADAETDAVTDEDDRAGAAGPADDDDADDESGADGTDESDESDESDEGADAAAERTRVLGEDAHDGATSVLPADAPSGAASSTQATDGTDATDAAADEDEEWADEEWADDPEAEGGPAEGDWSEDEWAEEQWAVADAGPPRRPGTVAALALPLLALGLGRPGAALAVAVVLAVLVRSVGLDAAALQRRRARHGTRPSDRAGAVLTWPWYLVRGALGVLPAVVVGTAVVALVGGSLWWLVNGGYWVIAETQPGHEDGFLDGNEIWVGRAFIGLVAALGLGMVWFGPMGRSTREGARWVLGTVAPGPVGALSAVAVGVAVAVVLTVVMLGQDVVWWPLGGPPDLGN